MNANKPVAWMLADKKAEHIRSIMAVQHDFVPEGCVEIPLYTHPVKEEGEQQNHQEADGCPTELAVLQRFWRKAQEK